MIIPHNTILTAVVGAALAPRDGRLPTRGSVPAGTGGSTRAADVYSLAREYKWASTGKHTLANSNTERFTAASEV